VGGGVSVSMLQRYVSSIIAVAVKTIKCDHRWINMMVRVKTIFLSSIINISHNLGIIRVR